MFRKIKRVLFENGSVRQTVLKNTFWLSVSNMAGRLIRAALVIYAARVLGASDWGVFSYALTLAAFFTVLFDLGLGPMVTRELATRTEHEARAEALSTALFTKLGLLALGAAVLFLAVPYAAPKGIAPLIPAVLIILIADSLRDFGFALNRAFEKMEREAGLTVFTNIAITLCGGAALFLAPGLVPLAYAYGFGSLAGTLATWQALRPHFKDLGRFFRRRLVAPFLASSWPLALSATFGGIMLYTDTLILGVFRSPADLGFYGAAQRPVQLLYLFGSVIAVGIFPLISRLAREDEAALARAVRRVVTASLLAALPLALGGFVIAPQFMRLLFGSEYMPGAASFQILALTLLPAFPGMILSNVLFALRREKALFRYVVLGASLNVALDLLLIPRYGIEGSAWATLLTQCAVTAYIVRALPALRLKMVPPQLLRAAYAAGGMVLFLFGASLFRAPTLFLIAGGGAVYVALLLALKEPLLRELTLPLRRGTG